MHLAFIANGARSDQNNFLLDGVDNNSEIPDLSNNRRPYKRAKLSQRLFKLFASVAT